MRVLIVVLANALLFSLAVIALASEETQPVDLEYHLRAVPIEPPDQQTLDRYRRRPSNIQCNLIEFSVDRLVDLILRIESGEVSVTDSSIAIVPFGREALRFDGFYSSANVDDGKEGPYEWTGRLPEESYFKASFVISEALRLTGKIDSPKGTYSLSQSHWSGNQFLCEIDPSSLPTKID